MKKLRLSNCKAKKEGGRGGEWRWKDRRDVLWMVLSHFHYQSEKMQNKNILKTKTKEVIIIKVTTFQCLEMSQRKREESKKKKDYKRPWLRQLCISPLNTLKCSTVHFHLSANLNKWEARNEVKWGSSFTTLENKLLWVVFL